MKINSDELLEFYEKLYFHEINVRDVLINRLQLPITMATSLLGVYSYIVTKIDFCNFKTGNIIFLLLFSSSVFIFLISLYNIFQAMKGYDYKYLPTSNNIEKYRKELADYYGPQSNTEFDEDFRKYLIEEYNFCSSHNAERNEKRTHRMYLFNKWTMVSVFLLISAYILFVLCNLSKTETHEVNISTPVKISVLQNKINEVIMSDDKKVKNSDVPKQNTTLKKPARPELRTLNESKDTKLLKSEANKSTKENNER